MQITVSDVLEAAGAVLLLTAAALWQPVAALALLGILLLVAGYLTGSEVE